MLDKHDSDIILANSLEIEIPYSFIRNKVSLTWNELYYGIEYGFLTPEEAINKAEEEILEETELSGPLFELACLYKGESYLIIQYITKLIDKEYFGNDDNIQYVKEKWLFIVLAWLYENSEKYNILYSEQEYSLHSIGEKLMIVWDDFGFPDVIEELVDLAPSFDGTSNDARFIYSLNLTWQKYLKREEIRFNLNKRID